MADADDILKTELIRTSGDFMSALVLCRHHRRENATADNFTENLGKIERISNLILEIVGTISDLTGNFVMPDEKKIISGLYPQLMKKSDCG